MRDLRLFSGDHQHQDFPRYRNWFPTAVMPASKNPQPLPSGELSDLPAHFRSAGSMRSTSEFLAATNTVAVLVMVDGHVRHEVYASPVGPTSPGFRGRWRKTPPR